MESVKKLMREAMKLQQSPPEGIRLKLAEEDSFEEMLAFILGPQGTPFDGGCFKVRIVVTPDYPNVPPKCTFVTKIFHPNVSPTSGEICVSTLKKDWKKDLGLEHILLTIKCLLMVPNAESALNEEAGRLLLEAYEDYEKRAQMMTKIHAVVGHTEYRALSPSKPVSGPPTTGERPAQNSSETDASKIANTPTTHENGSENAQPANESTKRPAVSEAKKKLDSSKKRHLKRL